eukprot:263723-Prymnesium_polylepis.2
MNNVGFSSAYQSEQHPDFFDGSLALAFSGKCPRHWTLSRARAREHAAPVHQYSYSAVRGVNVHACGGRARACNAHDR